MDKLTAIKIKYDDGTYSDEIPISVLSENVEWDNTHTLVDVLGSIDVDAKGTIQDQIDKLSAQGAGAHNSIYRGKNLGTSVTYKQWAEIKAGTFNDLYIGDYWTIGGVNWRIAAFDYWLHCGDKECTTHHVVIVPDSCLYNAQMHNTASGGWESSGNTTEGAYAGSDMRTKNLETAKSTINSAFGSNHVLNHREHLQNAVTNGYASGGAWMDSTVELMNEEQVYGCMQFKPGNSLGSTIPNIYNIDYSQFPLFRLNKAMISNRANWWLRDVVSAAGFCRVDLYGGGYYVDASHSIGVRPAFGIYQS